MIREYSLHHADKFYNNVSHHWKFQYVDKQNYDTYIFI